VDDLGVGTYLQAVQDDAGRPAPSLTWCGNGSANVTGWCFDQQRIVDRGEPDVTYGTGLGVLTAVLAPLIVMERETVLTCLIEVAAERPCLDPLGMETGLLIWLKTSPRAVSRRADAVAQDFRSATFPTLDVST
jgi:hypothetical protein